MGDGNSPPGAPVDHEAVRCRRLRADGVCLLILAVLLVIFFWRYVTPDASARILFPGGDFIDQHYAWRYYASFELAQGRLPVWTPFANAGHPFLADIQSAVLYPIHLALALLLWLRGNPQLSLLDMEWLVIFHFFLAGSFTYLLVKHQTGRRLAGLASGLVFMLSGYLTTYPPLHPVILEVFTWMPLVLLLIAKAVSKRSLPIWLMASLALSVSTLAGHPQQSAYVYYLTGAYGLFTIASTFRRENRGRATPIMREALPQVACLALTLFLSVLLSAAQLLPFGDLTTYASRGENLAYSFTQSGFGLMEAFGVLFPDFHGGKPLFIGSATLLLIAASLWRPRPKDTLFWVGAAAVAILLSFGGKLPFYNAAYCCLPGFSWFRDQERIVSIFSLGGSILAGYGTASILGWAGPERRRRLRTLQLAAIAGAAAAVATAAASASMVSFYDPRLIQDSLVMAGAIGASSLCIYLTSVGKVSVRLAMVGLITITTAQLMIVNWKNLEPGGEDPFLPTPLTEYLQGLPENSRIELADLSPNTGLVSRIRVVRGAGPLVNKYVAGAMAWPDLTKALQLLNAGYIVWHVQEDAEPALFWYQGYGVRKAPYQTAPAYVAFRSQVEDDKRILDALGQSQEGTGRDDFVFGRDALLSGPLDIQSAGAGFVRTIQTSPDDGGRLSVQLDSSAPGVLVISEVYDKGWKAYLDGAEAKVVRVNYLLLGLAVPAGPHVVELVYAPESVRIGFGLSILAIYLLLAIAALSLPWRPSLKRQALAGLLLAACLTSIVSWQSLSPSTRSTTAVQWEDLSRFLEANTGPGDAVVLAGSDQPASLRLPPGANPYRAEDLAKLSLRSRIWWLSTLDKPGSGSGRPTPADGFQTLRNYWFGNLSLSLMAPTETVVASAPRRLDRALDTLVALRGYGISAKKVDGVKDALEVSLYWQTLASLEKDYAVLVQLLNEQGKLVAQDDSHPVSGERPTSGWEAGEVVVDPHTLRLPDGLALGDYTLIAGLYDSEGRRLPDSAGQDHIVLERIRLGY